MFWKWWEEAKFCQIQSVHRQMAQDNHGVFCCLSRGAGQRAGGEQEELQGGCVTSPGCVLKWNHISSVSLFMKQLPECGQKNVFFPCLVHEISWNVLSQIGSKLLECSRYWEHNISAHTVKSGKIGCDWKQGLSRITQEGTESWKGQTLLLVSPRPGYFCKMSLNFWLLWPSSAPDR